MGKRSKGQLYLLHFEPAYRHARHYLGFTETGNVNFRVAQHIAGYGSPLVHAAVLAGCKIYLATIISGDRTLERKLKVRSAVQCWCPRCRRQVVQAVCTALHVTPPPLDAEQTRLIFDGGSNSLQQDA